MIDWIKIREVVKLNRLASAFFNFSFNRYFSFIFGERQKSVTQRPKLINAGGTDFSSLQLPHFKLEHVSRIDSRPLCPAHVIRSASYRDAVCLNSFGSY